MMRAAPSGIFSPVNGLDSRTVKEFVVVQHHFADARERRQRV